MLLSGHECRAVARWLKEQPPPTSPHDEVIRHLVEAGTAERAEQVAASTLAAAELVSVERLIGVLLDAPNQLWARSGATHSGHPLLLDVVERLASEHGEDRPALLTGREIDLLRLLRLSLTVEQLADRLFVSAHTVKWHRANIYLKLGARNRHDAICAAVDCGLLESPGSSRLPPDTGSELTPWSERPQAG